MDKNKWHIYIWYVWFSEYCSIIVWFSILWLIEWTIVWIITIYMFEYPLPWALPIKVWLLYITIRMVSNDCFFTKYWHIIEIVSESYRIYLVINWEVHIQCGESADQYFHSTKRRQYIILISGRWFRLASGWWCTREAIEDGHANICWQIACRWWAGKDLVEVPTKFVDSFAGARWVSAWYCQLSPCSVLVIKKRWKELWEMWCRKVKRVLAIEDRLGKFTLLDLWRPISDLFWSFLWNCLNY